VAATPTTGTALAISALSCYFGFAKDSFALKKKRKIAFSFVFRSLINKNLTLKIISFLLILSSLNRFFRTFAAVLKRIRYAGY